MTIILSNIHNGTEIISDKKIVNKRYMIKNVEGEGCNANRKENQ